MAHRNPYTIRTYFRDKLALIVAMLVFAAFMTFMLVVLGVARDGIILLDVLLLVVLLVILALDFARRRRFWKTLVALVESLDRVELFENSIEEAAFLDGAIAKDALTDLAACAIHEIDDLKIDSKAHSQYFEQWVHEVKTPIAAVKLILDHSHGPQFDALRQEVERIEGLVNQALYAARADSLTNDYMINEVQLSQVVAEACKSNMQLLTAKGVRLDIRIDSSIKVLADKSWVEFVLSQVIVNSAKYDSSQIIFRIKEEESDKPGKRTVLEIQDDGCGIPAEDVPRAFDRGFTGQVGRSHGSATGMGLYLSAIMCAKMGVGISLSSELGKGTRVDLSFPHDDRIRNLAGRLTLS